MKKTSVILSSHVIDTVKALSEEDRKAIAAAIVEDFVLGGDPEDSLSPFQAMIYTIISYYIKRDSLRGAEVIREVI